MKFQIISIFPQIFEALRIDGVVGQALKSGRLEMQVVNPREFTQDIHRSVDDKPYGGGDGMLMLAEPLMQAYEGLADPGHVIVLSPKGKLLTDAMVQKIAGYPTVTLICGRYAGIDQRFLNSISHEEVSIGDYVLSGGELPAMVLVDSVARFIPGVLGDENSVHRDSVTMGRLEAPQFTRPRDWRGQVVPEVLLSGNHRLIEQWNLIVGTLLTYSLRPDLMAPLNLNEREKKSWLSVIDEILNNQPEAVGISREKWQAFRNYVGLS
jgi:tRNA (guanine37-N1)-methyltransferase